MTRAQERVDARAELTELAAERAEQEYVPTGSGRYWERQVEMTTDVQVDDDGAMSYTTETTRGNR